MKKIIKWLKWFWDKLGEPIEYTDGHNPFDEPMNLYRKNRSKENTESWCPYCGYNGTTDQLRCHLLNDHKQ